MPAVDRPDITWSCSHLGMHGDQCSRSETCTCSCHQPAKGGQQ